MEALLITDVQNHVQNDQNLKTSAFLRWKIATKVTQKPKIKKNGL